MQCRSFFNRALSTRIGLFPKYTPQRGRFYSQKYEQEHDYSVKPTTYVYAAEENKEMFDRFPLISAKAQARRQARPRKSRMLAREFIEDSMYNPQYGYFSKQAEIFTLPRKIDAQKIGNLDAYLDEWAIEYRNQQALPEEDKSLASDSGTATAVPESEKKHLRRTKVSKQLWHTPSELFSPHYGETLARYLVETHARDDSGSPLVIYETGAGNGTLMSDIINYVQREHPELYENMEYHIIEISAQLALKQRSQGHSDKVRIHNCSIFDWKVEEVRPCFFIALEVWDNLAHDVIRYDANNRPYQGYVVIDHNNEFTEVFSPKLDKLAQEFLDMRNELPSYNPQRKLGWHPLKQPTTVRHLINNFVPFQGEFSAPEYIPTRQFQFMKTLAAHFPKHKLLVSDFTHFTERIRGYNSPVVQTFMEDSPVTVSTFMVFQGHFDIMFPTDFRTAQQMYERITGKRAEIASNEKFLGRWIEDRKETATKTGENPMLSLYQNADFFYTVD